MPQPVKISDALLLDARQAGEVMHRSINGQIEHWAQLGRSIERLLNGQEIHRLRTASPPPLLSDIMASINQPSGRARLQAVLDAKPFPHFRAVPGDRRLMEKIDEDGTKTVGEFIERKFVPVARKIAK
jgi:ParD-like antitoxin of type II bacterial toxin-antitoxin system